MFESNSGSDANSFANMFSFMGLPLSRNLENVDAVVMGIPYDLGTSARSGTRYGPNGIRQASAILRWEQRRFPWSFSLCDRLRAIDYGDIDYDVGDSQMMIDETVKHAHKVIAAGKFLLSFGGDHFISWPLLLAAAKTYPKMALVHFDAHTDTEAVDLEFYHGSMFYRADKAGIIDPQHSTQIGIRTEYNPQGHEFMVLDAPWVNTHSAEVIANKIVERCGDLPVYLTVDIDCLDPAYAPGTGTPVVGGMTSDHLLQIIRRLTPLNIIAADVNEVSPAYDHAEITALAAASVALDLLFVHATSKS